MMGSQMTSTRCLCSYAEVLRCILPSSRMRWPRSADGLFRFKRTAFLNALKCAIGVIIAKSPAFSASSALLTGTLVSCNVPSNGRTGMSSSERKVGGTFY
jgi:hypothetical protein